MDKARRLVSLDLLRGLDMLFLAVVSLLTCMFLSRGLIVCAAYWLNSIGGVWMRC